MSASRSANTSLIQCVKVTREKIDHVCRPIKGTIITGPGVKKHNEDDDNQGKFDVEEIQKISDYICENYCPVDKNHATGSYRGKHQIEKNWPDGNIYVSNGVFIVACLVLDIKCENNFRYGPGTSLRLLNPNCMFYIAMSKDMDKWWLDLGNRACELQSRAFIVMNIIQNNYGKSHRMFNNLKPDRFFMVKGQLDRMVSKAYPRDVHYLPTIPEIGVTDVFYQDIEAISIPDFEFKRKRPLPKKLDGQMSEYVMIYILDMLDFLEYISSEDRTNDSVTEYKKFRRNIETAKCLIMEET